MQPLPTTPAGRCDSTRACSINNGYEREYDQRRPYHRWLMRHRAAHELRPEQFGSGKDVALTKIVSQYDSCRDDGRIARGERPGCRMQPPRVPTRGMTNISINPTSVIAPRITERCIPKLLCELGHGNTVRLPTDAISVILEPTAIIDLQRYPVTVSRAGHFVFLLSVGFMKRRCLVDPIPNEKSNSRSTRATAACYWVDDCTTARHLQSARTAIQNRAARCAWWRNETNYDGHA
jgi:hypothetical protein